MYPKPLSRNTAQHRADASIQSHFKKALQLVWRNCGYDPGWRIISSTLLHFINAVTNVISSLYNLYAEDLQLYRHFNFEELADVVTAITNDLLNVCSLAKAFWLHDNLQNLKLSLLVAGSCIVGFPCNLNVFKATLSCMVLIHNRLFRNVWFRQLR